MGPKCKSASNGIPCDRGAIHFGNCDWSETLDLQNKLVSRIDRLSKENYELRKLLWLNHGCTCHAAYGDDGEMQCNNVGCMIDFKRMSTEEIQTSLFIQGER